MFGQEGLYGWLLRTLGVRGNNVDQLGSVHEKLNAIPGIASPLFPKFGTGVNGDYSSTGNTTLGDGIWNFNNFTINAGHTITPIWHSFCILAKGVVTINGTLSATGKGEGGAINPSYVNDSVLQNGYAGTNGYGPCGGGGGASGGYISNTSPYWITGGNGGITDLWAGGGTDYSTDGGIGANADGVFSNGGWLSANIRELLKFRGAGGGSAPMAAGGGSNRPTCYGGNGGAGGGCIIIEAPAIIVNGAIRADGLNGTNGAANSGQYSGSFYAGGGGGGGGGFILLRARSIQINGAVSANGGAGGLGHKDIPSGGGKAFSGYDGGAGGRGLVVQQFIN
jgi:hypothetical protein